MEKKIKKQINKVIKYKIRTYNVECIIKCYIKIEKLNYGVF